MQRGPNMLSALKISEYILSLSNPDEGDIISNLKLQKLLYYAQGLYLALNDKPLFSEDIYAWKLGPVVKEVYHKYKGYEANYIPPPEDIDFGSYEEEIKDFLNEIYTIFGQYSAWRLCQMTHDEPPWKDTPCDEVIPHEKMKEYFKTLLVNAE